MWNNSVKGAHNFNKPANKKTLQKWPKYLNANNNTMATSNMAEYPSLHLKAIAYNNHAAFLVETGNYVDAISILSKAHKCSKYGLDQCIRQARLPAVLSIVSPLDAFMASAPPATHQCYSEDSDKPETYNLIHRRAIQLPPCLSNDYYSRVVVSVAIIFNLALAHHLFALEQAPGSSKSETMLRKALKFYECSFIILRAQHHAKTPKGSLLLMATINSSGHIHIILGEEEHAGTCFRNLFSTLTCLGYRGGQEEGGHGPALEVFFRTTSQYLVRDGPSCPAAAA